MEFRVSKAAGLAYEHNGRMNAPRRSKVKGMSEPVVESSLSTDNGSLLYCPRKRVIGPMADSLLTPSYFMNHDFRIVQKGPEEPTSTEDSGCRPARSQSIPESQLRSYNTFFEKQTAIAPMSACRHRWRRVPATRRVHGRLASHLVPLPWQALPGFQA